MKKLRYLVLFLASLMVFSGCQNDEEVKPSDDKQEEIQQGPEMEGSDHWNRENVSGRTMKWEFNVANNDDGEITRVTGTFTLQTNEKQGQVQYDFEYNANKTIGETLTPISSGGSFILNDGETLKDVDDYIISNYLYYVDSNIFTDNYLSLLDDIKLEAGAVVVDEDATLNIFNTKEIAGMDAYQVYFSIGSETEINMAINPDIRFMFSYLDSVEDKHLFRFDMLSYEF